MTIRPPHLARVMILLAACGAAVAAKAPEREAKDEVKTESGWVTGVSSGAGKVYKGVPFAAPPVGALRWRSPMPPVSWGGIRRAESFGPPCAQAPSSGRTEVSSVSREDCLYLNIWTPDRTASAPLPVMVWIHGGGFQNGMGTSPTYDGAALAARGVVVVTINYRLGVFGFLAHPELTAQSSRRSSGNFGLEDQIAALRWVARNIRAFGGDPKNVTLFGQSAGGASVVDLIDSPSGRGLFRRAIIESGAARGAMAALPMAAAERQGLALAEGASLGALRKMDMAEVLRRAVSSQARFAPVADGVIVTGSSGAAPPERRPSVEAVLIGSNSREGLGNIPPEALGAAIRSAFGTNADRALRFYGLAEGSEPVTDRVLGTPAQQFVTDTSFRCGSVDFALGAARSGQRVWQYQFEQFVPGREAQGAAHSFEVPYVFGNLSKAGFSAADYGPADRALSDLMIGYWTNFAKTGDPNGVGLPRWPNYDEHEKAYARLSSELHDGVEVGRNLRGAICALLPSPMIQQE